MQNFDVQLNLLIVKKVPLVVLTMCLALLQWGAERSLFSTFVRHLGQTLEKVANALKNIFHPFLSIVLFNIVNVFTMDGITLQMR